MKKSKRVENSFRKKSKSKYGTYIFRNNVNPIQVSKNSQTTVLMKEVALGVVQFRGEVYETT